MPVLGADSHNETPRKRSNEDGSRGAGGGYHVEPPRGRPRHYQYQHPGRDEGQSASFSTYRGHGRGGRVYHRNDSGPGSGRGGRSFNRVPPLRGGPRFPTRGGRGRGRGHVPVFEPPPPRQSTIGDAAAVASRRNSATSRVRRDSDDSSEQGEIRSDDEMEIDPVPRTPSSTDAHPREEKEEAVRDTTVDGKDSSQHIATGETDDSQKQTRNENESRGSTTTSQQPKTAPNNFSTSDIIEPHVRNQGVSHENESVHGGSTASSPQPTTTLDNRSTNVGSHVHNQAVSHENESVYGGSTTSSQRPYRFEGPDNRSISDNVAPHVRNQGAPYENESVYGGSTTSCHQPHRSGVPDKLSMSDNFRPHVRNQGPSEFRGGGRDSSFSRGRNVDSFVRGGRSSFRAPGRGRGRASSFQSDGGDRLSQWDSGRGVGEPGRGFREFHGDGGVDLRRDVGNFSTSDDPKWGDRRNEDTRGRSSGYSSHRGGRGGYESSIPGRPAGRSSSYADSRSAPPMVYRGGGGARERIDDFGQRDGPSGRFGRVIGSTAGRDFRATRDSPVHASGRHDVPRGGRGDFDGRGRRFFSARGGSSLEERDAHHGASSENIDLHSGADFRPNSGGRTDFHVMRHDHFRAPGGRRAPVFTSRGDHAGRGPTRAPYRGGRDGHGRGSFDVSLNIPRPHPTGLSNSSQPHGISQQELFHTKRFVPADKSPEKRTHSIQWEPPPGYVAPPDSNAGLQEKSDIASEAVAPKPKTPPPPSPPPEPAEPSALTQAIVKMAEAQAKMELAFSKHLTLQEECNILLIKYQESEGLPVGLEAFEEDLKEPSIEASTIQAEN